MDPRSHNQNENKIAWPMDAGVTQMIFAMTSPRDLLQLSLTCTFFRTQAIELAKKTLLKECRIQCLPSSLPVPLLACVKPYYDALNIPIDTCETAYFTSFGDYAVRPGAALLAICVQRDKKLCIVGTFSNKSNAETAEDKAHLVYQFVAGIDDKGHLSVKRITKDDLQTLVSGVLNNNDEMNYVSAITGCLEEDFNQVLNALFSTIQRQEKITFRELIETVVNCRIGTDKNTLLKLIDSHIRAQIVRERCNIL